MRLYWTRLSTVYAVFALFLVAYSLTPQIRECVIQLSQLLARVSGSGMKHGGFLPPNQQANIQQESDVILQPLIDFLHGRY